MVQAVKKICLQCRRPGFDTWVGKIPWKRAKKPTPVLLPGESPWTEEPGGLQSMGVAKSQTWLSGYTCIWICYLEMDFVDVIKLRILKWGDYPGLFRCVQCSHKGGKSGRVRKNRNGNRRGEKLLRWRLWGWKGVSQGMQPAWRRWESQGNDFLPRDPRTNPGWPKS